MFKRKLIMVIGIALIGITLVALPSIAATTGEENENSMQNYMTEFGFNGNEMMNSSGMLEMHDSEIMQEMHNSPEMQEAMNDQDYEKMQDVMDSYSETKGLSCH